MSVGQVECFEDLIAWQRARALVRSIYHVTQEGRFAKDGGLAQQIQRAAVSAMSNVAEGFERGSAADFFRFLTMANASCAEVRSQLYVALDVDYINQEEFNQLREQTREVGRIIGGLRSSVARRRPQ
jgi:four helix bundle protein